MRNLIVDDLGYSDEPLFQDGLIAQGVNTVVGAGSDLLQRGGQRRPTSGYLSTFRASTGTITGLGSGTFMNFNPSGGDQPAAADHDDRSPTPDLIFEFDQPFADAGAGRVARHA